MRNTELDEAQAGIKISGRNINNLRYTDDTTLTAESKEELKILFMKIKEQSEKASLKQHSENEDHGIWSHYCKANRRRKKWKLRLSGAPESLQMVTAAMKLKDTCSLEENL